ncbi:hypothetical protein MMC25_000098 [Agyrium rufum]|nr:hypothetical protein [Agyrium rufum]
MTIFVLFFVELMIMRADIFANPEEDLERNGHSHELTSKQSNSHSSPTHTPGEDHLGHSREHDALQEKEAETSILPTEKMPVVTSEEYAAQLTGIFILEFGIIFHSVFVGFTLAVAGPEFSTLYVVLVFHQMFEGLGLGSRLAATPWPARKWFLPYLLGSAYGLTTPIAIAVGLGIRTTYAPGSQTALIVNGVFDSISAGILIYTGLVELLAHEFMFSSTMRRASLKVVLLAFGTMVLGAGKLVFSILACTN